MIRPYNEGYCYPLFFLMGSKFFRRLMRPTVPGFSMAEILIAIVIITILTIASISVYTAQIQKARDTERKNDVAKVAGFVDEIIAKFGIPPMENPSTRRKLPADCALTAANPDLLKCFKKLKMSTDEDLKAVLSDPLQGTLNQRTSGAGDRTYGYFYGADQNAYKICTMMEDQGAYDILNSNYEGTTEQFADGKNDNLFCVKFNSGGNEHSGVSKIVDPAGTSS